MLILQFKGKTFVQNHHLAVKYHQLVPKKDLSLTDKVSLHDNLIIQGDNLKALKAGDIAKAKGYCTNAGEEVVYHFHDIRKTIYMSKGAEK